MEYKSQQINRILIYYIIQEMLEDGIAIDIKMKLFNVVHFLKFEDDNFVKPINFIAIETKACNV